MNKYKYKNSAHGKVTAWMRKNQVYTKSQIVEQFKKLGKGDKAALASAVVMLSPRLVNKKLSRVIPYGVSYNEPLTKTAGIERKFRFRINGLED